MSRPKPPPAPSERSETVRAALRRRLSEGPASAHELSAAAGIREKDVEAHLEHLAKSLKAEGHALVVTPASCLSCGYVFADRKRLSRPGACPRYRGTHLDPPLFSLG